MSDDPLIQKFTFSAWIIASVALVFLGNVFPANALANETEVISENVEIDEQESIELKKLASADDLYSITDGFLFDVSGETLQRVLALPADQDLVLPVPVLFGISIGQIENSWGDYRSGGRRHEGADLIVRKGSLVISPTESAVVTKLGYDNMGGNYVITANPGGEQFYYAHLDSIAGYLKVGTELQLGDIIGTVGSSGNAAGPHLHFGIYHKGIAQDPHPRLQTELSLDEKMAALERSLGNLSTGVLIAIEMLENNRSVFDEAEEAGIALPAMIQTILDSDRILITSRLLDAELTIEDEGQAVITLQEFLINQNAGADSERLADAGATGYFGAVTQNALAEYQSSVGISPAAGYFGPLTKASVLNSIYLNESQATAESDPEIENVLIAEIYEVSRDLEVGHEGDDVRWLQNFLITESAGPKTTKLASVGATGYFGEITKQSLAEYQANVGISPAAGYFGPLTRSFVKRN